MCGKFTQKRDLANLVRLARAFPPAEGADETVTPMRFANIIALDGKGERKSVRMRWGMVPSSARDPSDAKPHIHARAETIDTKPAFRDSFKTRRGLIVVSSFNEGEEVTPSRTTQYVCTPKDGAPMTIAAVWNRRGSGETLLLSFAMVTVAANPTIAAITDRMPALIEDGDWAKWLGEEPASAGELKAMLKPSPRDLDMRRAGKPPPPKHAGQAELF